MSDGVRLSSPLTTSHVNKHLRYRLSRSGYAWLLLTSCCFISLALQIISMSTKEHLIGEAGSQLIVNGAWYHGSVRRTYSIFHQCSAPPLTETSTQRVYLSYPCVNPTSECPETRDRMRTVQAGSIIALVFTAIPALMLLVVVPSHKLRAMMPLIISILVLIAIAFVARLILWSLIVDFTTNVSLCNNAFPVVPGVVTPRFGPSFIVEVISWIFLLFTMICLLIVLAFESGMLNVEHPDSSSTSSDDEKVHKPTHPDANSELRGENTVEF